MHTLLRSFISGPKIYTIYTADRKYSPNILESAGDYLFNCYGFAMNSFLFLSPILVPYIVFNHSYSSTFSAARLTVGVYMLAYSLRTLGRITNGEYRNFIHLLNMATSNGADQATLKSQLKIYDYQMYAAPVDFTAKNSPKLYGISEFSIADSQPLGNPLNVIRNVVSWVAVHTFGKRLLFPGALSLMNFAVNPALVDGRRKYTTEYNGQRNIIKTDDGNMLIDTMFIDRRGQTPNGNTLVICCDGNAGYYETGVFHVPTHDYSVLGWNIPGFGESTGKPMPESILKSMDGVMQFAMDGLGFKLDQIVIYAWSIGGFSAAWTAAQFPGIKALIMDACFDDLVPLAASKLPSALDSIVRYSVRKHLDMPVSKMMTKYHGPILIIRRWNDEIIVTQEMTADQETKRASNRANNLLINLIKSRYPQLIQSSEDEDCIHEWLALDNEERLMMFHEDSCEPKIPANLDDVGDNSRFSLIRQLCFKYFIDFESTHNIPLPPELFTIPTAIISN